MQHNNKRPAHGSSAGNQEGIVIVYIQYQNATDVVGRVELDTPDKMMEEARKIVSERAGTLQRPYAIGLAADQSELPDPELLNERIGDPYRDRYIWQEGAAATKTDKRITANRIALGVACRTGVWL